VLYIALDLVATSNQVELAVSKEAVEVEAPGIYAPLRVPLPPNIDDTRAGANWTSKTRHLKITLPCK